ncbi:hypothetical protein Bca52824_014119 [Brassica carinata]|uniref:Uncharacterized protein n=1 Tax=Brassica carinata TaxID=52824 RepID=A0A8X7W0N6_BRACI|nr:hypothetical protein Bca52824_014119 [Brassica carinata]
MRASILSSKIFFLIFIIFSLFVNAHMEHRKLIGAKETMAMRRKLDGNGSGGNKIAAHGSNSQHDGAKTQTEPSKNRPEHATTGTTSPEAGNKFSECARYSRCKRMINS